MEPQDRRDRQFGRNLFAVVDTHKGLFVRSQIAKLIRVAEQRMVNDRCEALQTFHDALRLIETYETNGRPDWQVANLKRSVLRRIEDLSIESS